MFGNFGIKKSIYFRREWDQARQEKQKVAVEAMEEVEQYVNQGEIKVRKTSGDYWSSANVIPSFYEV
jgi:hypothetical protein